MALAIAISVFLGLVAALSLLSCVHSIRTGISRGKEAYAELNAINRASLAKPVRLRRPQEAFAQLAA